MIYKSGYKYQLAANELFAKTNITPSEVVETDYLILTPEGDLLVQKGYAWDGPSGPTFDSVNSLRASLAHDAIYQLIRMEEIGIGWRTDADILLDTILEQDGMWKFRRWYWLKGVRWFAASAADPENLKPTLAAP